MKPTRKFWVDQNFKKSCKEFYIKQYKSCNVNKVSFYYFLEIKHIDFIEHETEYKYNTMKNNNVQELLVIRLFF